jgi:hypothetical protein
MHYREGAYDSTKKSKSMGERNCHGDKMYGYRGTMYQED